MCVCMCVCVCVCACCGGAGWVGGGGRGNIGMRGGGATKAPHVCSLHAPEVIGSRVWGLRIRV